MYRGGGEDHEDDDMMGGARIDRGYGGSGMAHGEEDDPDPEGEIGPQAWQVKMSILECIGLLAFESISYEFS